MVIRRQVLIAANDFRKSVQYRWRQRGFTPREIERAVLGVPLQLWIADTDARDWYERSSYLVGDWHEMEFVRDHMVRSGDVVIDCGAHQGVTAMLLARWVGDHGQVIAIDPVEHNVRVAERNIKRNGFNNIRLLHAAAGRASGTARIGGGTNVQVGAALLGAAVRVMPLDELVSMRPTLVKLDVEGAEGEVFEGADRLLDLFPRVALELHVEALQKFGRSVESVLEPLHRRGYAFWVQWEDHERPRPLRPDEPLAHRVHLFAFPPTEPGPTLQPTG